MAKENKTKVEKQNLPVDPLVDQFDQLKGKLRKKYHSLKDFDLGKYDLDQKAQMLEAIQRFLGFGSAEWEHQLSDL